MANVKITELTNLTDPSTTDVMPVVDVDADVTKKVSVGEVVGKITGDVEVATDGTATISELPVSKLQDGAARQLLQTAANGTDVEWTDDVDLPGTLDVTGVTTLDDALNVAGLASLDGGIDVDGVFTVADATGNVSTSGTLGVTGQSTLASAAISDLTEDRVVIAGASGELEDSANLTFDGSELGITGTLDVSSNGTIGGDLTVVGDLTVEGATTTLETQTVTVEDKNIELGVVDTPTDTTANGGGITLKGATDKTINWVNATDAWTSSEHIELASGKEFYIDGNGVLNATTLGSGVVNSSLTSVGTIATGTWQGTAIDATYLDPTVVTTDDNGTVTSTMISDGTIVDGDINASAAIAGTKIDPDFGSQTVETTGVFSAAGGAAATPSIAFTGDLDTGIYSPGADQVAISTNGTGRLFVDSVGRVGLGGASSPVDDFHISTSNPSIVLEESDAGTDEKYWRTRVDNGAYIFEGLTDAFGSPSFWLRAFRATNSEQVDNIQFATSNSERLRITSDGKLGLGTSSPATTLDVNGDVTITDKIIHGGDTNTAIRFPAADTFAVETDGTERLRVDSSGNVGIGTTSPSSLDPGANNLVVGSGSGAEGITIYTGNASRGIINFADGTTGVQTYVGQVAYDHSANALTFGTSAAERARIDSSGRLLVGTSSSSLPTGIQIQGYAGGSTGQGILTLSRGSALPIANTTIGDIRFYDNGSGFGAKIEAETDGPWASSDYPGRLVFSTNPGSPATGPTERMRITSDAYVRLASGTGGIQFNGDTAAANALDDYEEGTHTTTATCTSGTVTLSSTVNELAYTKIGKLVSVHGRVSVSAISNPTGNLTLSLPFVSADLTDSAGRCAGSIRLRIVDTGYDVGLFSCSVDENSSDFRITYGGSTDTVDAAPAMKTGTQIYISITYRTT